MNRKVKKEISYINYIPIILKKRDLNIIYEEPIND